MNKITFNCEVVTPMFLHGADGKTAELRAPSIKGALRFWWRALHGNLDNKKLLAEEVKIFGGSIDRTSYKSTFSVQVEVNNFKTGSVGMLPHRDDPSYYPNKKNFKVSCICVKSTFKVSFTSLDKNSLIVPTYVFYLLSILGGLGQRVRRGNGSFVITKLDTSELDKKEIENKLDTELLEKINSYKNKETDFSKIKTDIKTDIERLFCKINNDYKKFYNESKTPYITNFEIGGFVKEMEKLRCFISNESHKHSTEKMFGKSGHFSSPLFITINKFNEKYYPIITLLKNYSLSYEQMINDESEVAKNDKIKYIKEFIDKMKTISEGK